MLEIREKITNIIGKFEDPYKEYYSHSGEVMWKWNYPISKYGKHIIVLCSAKKNFNEVLSNILDCVEEFERSNKIHIDRFRPYRNNLSEFERNFYDNLYINHQYLALRAFILFYRDQLSSTEVFNLINKTLIKDGIKISSKKANMFMHPF